MYNLYIEEKRKKDQKIKEKLVRSQELYKKKFKSK
jgi:hypothetical protein